MTDGVARIQFSSTCTAGKVHQVIPLASRAGYVDGRRSFVQQRVAEVFLQVVWHNTEAFPGHVKVILWITLDDHGSPIFFWAQL